MSTRTDAAVVAVVTTAPDSPVAEALATRLVEDGMAACANILSGVTSIYRWEGVIRRDSEVLVILKTTEDAVPALCDRIVELHPYDVPEVLAFTVADGAADYLSWVRDQVRVAE